MADGTRRPRVSAGILLFRQTPAGIEILLGHPGGPYFSQRNEGIWSIFKGEAEPLEDLWAVAEREFGEETGHRIGSAARRIDLGSVTQRGGKVVHAWAVEGDLDPAEAWSNTFPMEWPPHSGMTIEVPEIDRVAWASPDDARVMLNPAQAAFVDVLLGTLAVAAAASQDAAETSRADTESRQADAAADGPIDPAKE